jgi:hypothetical protein
MNKSTTNKMKALRCQQALDTLPDFLEGRLQGSELSELESHLETCQSCRQEQMEIAQVLGILDKREIPEPGEFFWSELRNRVHDELDGKRGPAIRLAFPKPSTAPLFAAATVLLFLAIWWTLPSDRHEHLLHPYLTQIEMEAERSLADLSWDHSQNQDLVEEVFEAGTGPSSGTHELLGRLSEAQLERLAERLEDLMG